jgi:hypothetical protein
MFRHMGKKVYGVVFLTLALCGVAMAVWYMQGAIEGSSTPTKAAKTTTPTVVPIKVTFAGNTLQPGEHEPLEVVIENTSPGATEVTFKRLTTTVTSSEEATCPKANLIVSAQSAFWKEVLEGKQGTATKVAPGATYNPNTAANAMLQVELSPTAPQTCETALFTVKMVAA